MEKNDSLITQIDMFKHDNSIPFAGTKNYLGLCFNYLVMRTQTEMKNRLKLKKRDPNYPTLSQMNWPKYAF